jgi:RHS repeat-associated protein
VILLAEHDEPSLAAKKKQRPVALEKATPTPKNRVWNFFGSPLGQIRSESDLSAETATGSVQFSYENASGRAYYYTRDHLGSIREMLNSSGTIVARYSYDPYGRTTLVSGSNLATFQYANYYAHQASGLEFAVYRAYDPSTGRWLGRDPVAERGGLNLYGYVGNNPFDREDPLGLCQCCLAEANALYDSAWQLLNDVSSAASGWGAPGMGNPEPPSGGEVAKEEAVKTLADMAGAEGTGGALTLEEIIFDLPGIINGQTIKGDAQSVRSAETAYNSCIKKQQSNPQCSFSEAQSKAQKAGTLIQRSTDLFNSKPGSEERRRATQGYPYYPKT